jgi:2-hydroxychromene-2-carboxylate isomerase
MSSDEVLADVIREAGYDAQDVLARANSPQYKNELRARTKEAKDTGLCGVPSYRVFRRQTGEGGWKLAGDIVWGQDELAVVEDLIAGWDGRRSVKEVEGESDGGRGGGAKL